MVGLNPPPAPAAAADVEVVADPQRARLGKLLEVLGRDALQDQLAAAARTAIPQPDHHHSVDPLGWLAVRVPAMGRARLAPGPPGVGLGIAPGERGGLPFGRPSQRPHLLAQPRVDLLEPFTLGLQPLPLGLQALDPLAQLPLLALQLLLPVPQRGVLVLQQRDPLAPPIRVRASQPVTHSRLPGHHRHEGRRLQPAHRAPKPAISIRWR